MSKRQKKGFFLMVGIVFSVGSFVAMCHYRMEISTILPTMGQEIKSGKISNLEQKGDVDGTNGTAGSIVGKEETGSTKLRKLLNYAGIDDMTNVTIELNVHPDNLDDKLDELWEQLTYLYYNNNNNNNKKNANTERYEPKIIGLERCQEYRETIARENRTIAIAGLFNSGTNAMVLDLRKNIAFVNRTLPYSGKWYEDEPSEREKAVNTGMMWSVPWHKHSPYPPTTFDWLVRRNFTHILPIVVVRDPFHWRTSMCTSPYGSSWKGTNRRTPRELRKCPRFEYATDDINRNDKVVGEPANTTTTKTRTTTTKTTATKKKEVIPLEPITLNLNSGPKNLPFESLMLLWNKFHEMYYNAEYPRLMVRLEDMIFNFPSVMESIRTCVDGKAILVPYRPHVDRSKWHGNVDSNFLSTIIKATDMNRRTKEMNDAEYDYSIQTLSQSDMISIFDYNNLPSKSFLQVQEE